MFSFFTFMYLFFDPSYNSFLYFSNEALVFLVCITKYAWFFFLVASLHSSSNQSLLLLCFVSSIFSAAILSVSVHALHFCSMVWHSFVSRCCSTYSESFLAVDTFLRASIFGFFCLLCCIVFTLEIRSLIASLYQVVIGVYICTSHGPYIHWMTFIWTSYNWTQCYRTRRRWTKHFAHGSIGHNSVAHR